MTENNPNHLIEKAARKQEKSRPRTQSQERARNRERGRD